MNRYIRGEFAVPEHDAIVAQLQPTPGPLYANDAKTALGLDGIVGVRIGYRWANQAARWEVCRQDDDGEQAGPWTPVPARAPKP